MNVAVLSGGVGGSRFVRGLLGVVDPAGVTIIGNVADDLEVLGLHVSPDLDSMLYTLTGLADEERGWGRADETWNALDTVATLGGESWFRLGDRDIGVHLVRTQLLREGRPSGSRTRSACSPRCCLRPTIRCARFSRRRPARCRSRPGSSRGVTGTRSTRCTTRARPRPQPRRV